MRPVRPGVYEVTEETLKEWRQGFIDLHGKVSLLKAERFVLRCMATVLVAIIVVTLITIGIGI